MKLLSCLCGLTLLCCSLQAAATDLPARGTSMADVERQYGAPREKLAPVGNPPVNRWVYDAYTVYFVGGTVSDTVAQTYHAQLLASAGTTAYVADSEESGDDEVQFQPMRAIGPHSSNELGHSGNGNQPTSIFENRPPPVQSATTPAETAQPAAASGSPAPATTPPTTPAAAMAEPVFKPLKPLQEPAPAAKAAPATTPSTAASEPVFKPLKPLNAAPGDEPAQAAASGADRAASTAAVNAALGTVTAREKATPPPPPPPPVDKLSSDGLFHRKGYAFDPVTGRIIVGKADAPAPAAASGDAAASPATSDQH